MELTAVFETWHIGDGNYPPLKKGMPVNLSFQIEPDQLGVIEAPAAQRFDHIGLGNYRFVGKVIRIYNDNDSSERIAVIDANEFRFYVQSPLAAKCGLGHHVAGVGTLVLDYYGWVEFLPEYTDPPDLFYKLRVERIRRLQMPEKFINRSRASVSYPSRLAPQDYESVDLTEVDLIEDESFVCFIVDFSDSNVPPGPLPRTFRT